MTPHDRPIHFGVEMKRAFDGCTWADSARRLEDLGYSTLYVPDHVHSEMGPIAAMATALAATTTLTVAPLVMAVDFRNPVLLAKEIATLDALFPGRVVLGLGAGYNPLDYSRTGIPLAPGGQRVSRLIEAVEVIRRLFAGDEFTHRGHEYTLEAVSGLPVPATHGGPRILVAGGGPRLLRFAAQSADIVGVNPSTAAGRDSPATMRDALPAAIDAKVSLVRETAGDRWDALELNAWISFALLTDDPAASVGWLADFAGVGVDDVLDSPIVLVGTESDLADRLLARRERWGYSSICIEQAQAVAMAGLVGRLAATAGS